MKTEALRYCIQAQYGKENYAEARKELTSIVADFAILTAGSEAMQEDARNNTATINRLKELNEKQAAEITALKKACIVYHNQIINMQADDE